MDKKIRTRFAPSPTGHLHIGGLRTALYSYALAKHFGGDFILRIEDTDKKREVEGSRQEIKQILSGFGLEWDELYVQSERAQEGIYKKYAEKLEKEGKAFYCNCKARDVKKQGYSTQLRDPCRKKNLKEGAIKIKVPDSERISYTDYVLDKEISWDLSTVSDTTILKSDGFPTYHLAVVIDDNQMKITHALRGYDWLPSTPIHLLLYKYFNLQKPEIGHLTDILDPDGGKLSKRKGSVSVVSFLKEGYLSEALLNFVMLLGWAPKNNQEIFSLSEFIKVFDKKGFQKSNPVFDRQKLNWMNGQYIRRLSVDEFNDKLQMSLRARLHPEGAHAPAGGSKEPAANEKWRDIDKNVLKKISPLIKTRISKLSEFDALAGFFFKKPKVDKKLFGKDYEKHLKTAHDVFSCIDDWTLSLINEKLMELVKNQGFKTGDFFMDLRIAVTGTCVTPPINDSIEILGKEETINRLKKALSTKS